MFEAIKPLSSNISSGIKPIDMSSFTSEQTGPKERAESFGNVFSNAFSNANKAMFYAGQTARIVAEGGNIELHEVAIADQKAKIALHLTTQIAGKLTQACSQIFQMQL